MIGHIVVHLGEFPGAATAAQACQWLADGIRMTGSGPRVIELPVADGGKDAVEALASAHCRAADAVHGDRARPLPSEPGLEAALDGAALAVVGPGDGGSGRASIEAAGIPVVTVGPYGTSVTSADLSCLLYEIGREIAGQLTPAPLDLGFAKLDLGRELRQGLPEVVYAPGKTAEQIIGIVTGLLAHNTGPVLVTRADPQTAAVVGRQVAEGGYDPEARLLSWRPSPSGEFRVLVVAAGTSDRPVAAEAQAVATAIGLDTTAVHDVGVAGLDRLLRIRAKLEAADVVIVVAGMEGALASVVGGLVGCPVIAVPTSTGYGASLEGVTALLAMHASCAAGITVVNIDSGFGAAMAAHRLAQVRQPARGAP